jgi:hypothetical protein
MVEAEIARVHRERAQALDATYQRHLKALEESARRQVEKQYAEFQALELKAKRALEPSRWHMVTDDQIRSAGKKWAEQVAQSIASALKQSRT